MAIPTALTIAGSDSSGGAGIQADLKTFCAFGVYGMSVLTSVTAQNTRGVLGIHDLPASFVALQLEAVCSDLPVDAVKTGMLSHADIVRAVAGKIREHGLTNLVVDPVMVATSGDRLLGSDALSALKDELLPLALIVTPNLSEAQVLSGMNISGLGAMREAARAIGSLGPRNVVIKGGHLPGQAIDLLFDGSVFIELAAERIVAPQAHGTGCTFSAAIAAGLASGKPVGDAVAAAKVFVTRAIQSALPLGGGHHPLDHRVSPAEE